MTDQIPLGSIAAGAASGAVGAAIGNPLFLVKARMQVSPSRYAFCTKRLTIVKAYSPALPVGTQHHYKNSFHALSTIFRAERFRGLVRGMDAAILRTATGSSVQLPTYNWTKNQLVTHGILPGNSIWTYLASSSVSGVCVVCRVTTSKLVPLIGLEVYCDATSRYSECTRLLAIRVLTSVRLSPGCTTSQQYGYPMDVYKAHYTEILLTVSGKLSRLKEYLGGIRVSRLATFPRYNSHPLETGSTAHFLRIAPHT